MTGTRDTQQDGSIQAMLRDSGLEAATELRSSLEQLRALVPEQAPAPRADLAALLAAGTATSPATRTAPLDRAPSADGALPAGVVSLAERRKSRNRRLAVVGGAVIGAMTLGAGAVAASSEDFRHNLSQSVGVIFQPPAHNTPAPQPAGPSPASVPAGPVPPSSPAATGTPSGTPAPAARIPGLRPTPAPAATPPAVGRGGILPAPAHASAARGPWATRFRRRPPAPRPRSGHAHLPGRRAHQSPRPALGRWAITSRPFSGSPRTTTA